VTAERAQKRDFEVRLDATGTVTAVNSVDVKPQVSSVISKVHVREGQFVKAGELLFTLDTRSDDANVAKAQAQLVKDQATLADAQRQLARSRDLLAQKFVSQAAVDTNLALVDAQSAAVAADKVAIDAARVGQSYGRNTAPGAGRVGAVNVFAGSSVQANTTTLLTITQLDPIYVSFNLPQRNIGDALQSLAVGGGRVTATLPDSKVALDGRLQFVDNAIDAASGTVKVKAVFDNKGPQLWPGAFVNVRMTVKTLKDAVIVPQAAVVQGPRGRVVFVIEPDDKAAARPVELLQASGPDAVVSGVRAGERVIVDGRQNIRPGMMVVERPAEGGRGARGAAASGARTGAASAAVDAASAAVGDGTQANAMPRP
jgi:RND family efflux transporter MFP subunit